MKINALTEDEVKHLKPAELVELLSILISSEIANTYQPGEIKTVSVPRPINVKDGGEDGKVEFEIPDTDSRFDNSKWIKSKYTMFQCKAQKMSDIACYKEIVVVKNKSPKALKPQIQKCFDVNGEYILFTTDSMVDATIINRTKSIRKGLKDTNTNNHANQKIRVLDANQIASWANEHISAIIYVQTCRGINRLGQFSTWAKWNSYYRAEKKYEYQESGVLKEYTDKLIELLETDKVVRVIGHKGLGKTRFVLESFNPKNQNQNIKNLSDTVVYINLATADPRELASFIINHSNLEGILVVDNCPNKWHESYSPLIIADGNLKLITIDDSPVNNKPNTIVLDRRAQREAVKLIFQNCFVGLTETEITHFVNISEGFPEMVPFIEDFIKDNSTQIIFNTIPSDFIRKFLFAESGDEQEYELFKACAVFSEFLFYDDKIEDLLSDAEKEKIKYQNKLIYTEISKKPSDQSMFYMFCTKYRDVRSLLEKKGMLHSVIPEPIAVNLAAEWWEQTSFEFVQNLLKELKDSELLIPMMDRLRSLDQSQRAQTIVSKAWGPNGPFSTAEVLNTELGSRLFRSVVEVNPEATVEALTFSFDEFTSDEMKDRLFSGRRNIVWALEKLAFRDETFIPAAKMLMKLAAGENENYGNNATGQLMQLFHIYLAGTQANFEKRLEILEWGLKHPETKVNLITISATGHGLLSHGFDRMIGAENQGIGKPLKEYEPENWNEIYAYWQKIIDLLVGVTATHPVLKQHAKQEIASSIRSLFSNGQSEMISQAIKKIAVSDSEIWPDAIGGLKMAISYENPSVEESNLIDSLLELLAPGNVKDKLKLTVIEPEWDYNPKDPNIDGNQVKAEQYASEIIQRKVDIVPFLADLLTGEQRQTFNFGAKLGLIENLDYLVDNIISVLAEIPEKEQNPALLAGILYSLNRPEQRKIISKLISIDSLIKQVFYLIRLVVPDKSEILTLFSLVDSGKVGVEHFMGFQYGRALDQLQPNEVLELCQKISEYGTKGGWTSFLLIFQYCFQDEEKWIKCKDFIRNLMLKYNFLTDFDNVSHSDEYKWSMYLLKLLKGNNDEQLAGILSTQIVEAANTNTLPSHERFIKDIARILCAEYFEVFWPEIHPILLENTRGYFRIKTLLGSYNGAHGYDGILFLGDLDKIFEWCRNTPKGAYRIAYIMPLFKDDTWSPFAKRMIDEFGKDEKFLNEIAANLGSFGMVGSSERYYNKIIEMAKSLLEHPIGNVRKWARNCIIHYQKRIRREKLEDEQRS